MLPNKFDKLHYHFWEYKVCFLEIFQVSNTGNIQFAQNIIALNFETLSDKCLLDNLNLFDYFSSNRSRLKHSPW